jgi:phage repressor protein C with HTH and peptisase S24 domain
MWALEIRQTMEGLGFTQEKLEEITERNGAKIAQRTISDIVRGKIHPKSLRADRFHALMDSLRLDAERFAKSEVVVAQNDSKPEQNIELLGYTRFPISYYLNGGKPVDELDYIFVRDDERKHLRSGTKFAKIVGSSMTDPDDPYGEHSLRDGETAWIDPHKKELRDGEVYAIKLPNNSETVKQLEYVSGEWQCRSYDRANNPTFKLEEGSEILGAVYRKQPASTPYKAKR